MPVAIKKVINLNNNISHRTNAIFNKSEK